MLLILKNKIYSYLITIGVFTLYSTVAILLNNGIRAFTIFALFFVIIGIKYSPDKSIYSLFTQIPVKWLPALIIFCFIPIFLFTDETIGDRIIEFISIFLMFYSLNSFRRPVTYKPRTKESVKKIKQPWN